MTPVHDFRERGDQLAAGQPETFSRTDDAGANQHVTLARLRTLFVANPLDRFWPVSLGLFLASAAGTAWAAVTFNPVSFMLGVHLDIAFALLAWNDRSRAAAARLLGQGRGG